MVEKVYIVNSGNSLQHASDNRRSMVSYTGLESCIAMQVWDWDKDVVLCMRTTCVA